MNSLYHSVINVALQLTADNFDAARKLARKFNATVRSRAKHTKVGPGVLPFKLTCSLVSIKAVPDRCRQYDALVVIVLFTVAGSYDKAHQFAGTSSKRIRREFRILKSKYPGVSLVSKVLSTHHIKRLLKTDRRVTVDCGSIHLR